MQNNKIHLIMPMAGKGSRFTESGFNYPKPLIEIHGRPFFYWATQSIRKFVSLESLTFVLLREHIEKYKIDQIILNYFPEAQFVVLSDVLNGAVLSCLEGVKNINNNAPIIFNDCDHIFSCPDFYTFCQKGDFSRLDGALLTFESSDPKFSFVQFADNGHVIRTIEKQAISNDAICGAYYFKSKELFKNAVDRYLRECPYNEYFLSGVYNILAENNKLIHAFRVNMHLPFGTPQEYERAIVAEDLFKGLK